MLKADLHIHTLLSPCASLEMTPQNIVDQAIDQGLDIIGITDHNTTRQVALVKKLAEKEGLFVLQGVEVCTKEEVHCLCFFPNDKVLNDFQIYLDKHLPNIPNKPDLLGDQIVINEKEEIVYEEKRSLLSAIDQSIDDIEEEIHRLNGLFIPAHVNRKMYGACSQLGFIPPWLLCDALEIHPGSAPAKHLPKGVKIIHNSDAHFLNDISKYATELNIATPSFESIKAYLNSKE